MQVIYNVGLPSREGRGRVNWLETLIEGVKECSDKDYILRLTSTIEEGEGIVYHISNGQNKTTVDLIRKNKVIYVKLYQRVLPDPEKYIKPAKYLVGSHEFSALDAVPETIAVLFAHLNQDNPYSKGEVTKVKVNYKPNQNTPWCFFGGRISAVDQLSDDSVKLTVEGGKWTYVIPLASALHKRVNKLKYIIFNENSDFDVVSSSEFDFYFEMTYDDQS